ncbi:hypothetical protein [Catellatospora sp. NPDC049133]|uniref:hypothetical protein n=1 Tax=Catellatospora sp. NPDC049133 TaxID=3155499 RepID=UPI0033CAA21D
MRRITAELVARRTDLRIGWDLRPGSLGPGPKYRLAGGRVEALDHRLDTIAAAEAPAGRLLNASSDLATVVMAGDRDLTIRRDGVDVHLPARGADSATLLRDGSLLVTAPPDDLPVGRAVQKFGLDGCPRVLLVSPAGAVLDEAPLPTAEPEMVALAHPHDGSVLLDAGEGQDGSSVFRVRADGDRVSVERILDDVVAAAFSPSGSRLLLMPHPSFGESVRVVSWPDLTLLHELTMEVLGEDEGFDVYGCFLSESRVVLSVFEAPPLVCTAELRPAGRIVLPPEYEAATPVTLFGYPEHTIGLDLILSNGTWASTVWRVP